MAEKNFKSRLAKVKIALKNLFKPTQKKIPVTQEIIDKEVEKFVKIKGYDLSDPTIDIKKFEAEFREYMESKNYEFLNVEASAEIEKKPDDRDDKLPKRIYTISEKLNKYTGSIRVFADTTCLWAGMVCYAVEKIEPTKKTPYVTYKPVPRIITQIHDNGVNGGTIFLTYEHKFVNTMDFNNNNNYNVISESGAIYSPLTEAQAKCICKLLNAQSRILYHQKMREIKKRSLLQLQK